MEQYLQIHSSSHAMKQSSWYLVRAQSVMSSTTEKQVTHMMPAITCTLISSHLYTE